MELSPHRNLISTSAVKGVEGSYHVTSPESVSYDVTLSLHISHVPLDIWKFHGSKAEFPIPEKQRDYSAALGGSFYPSPSHVAFFELFRSYWQNNESVYHTEDLRMKLQQLLLVRRNNIKYHVVNLTTISHGLSSPRTAFKTMFLLLVHMEML